MRDESELFRALQWRWGAYFKRNDHEWSYGHGDTCMEIILVRFRWFFVQNSALMCFERYTYDFLMTSRAFYC